MGATNSKMDLMSILNGVSLSLLIKSRLYIKRECD